MFFDPKEGRTMRKVFLGLLLAIVTISGLTGCKSSGVTSGCSCGQ